MTASAFAYSWSRWNSDCGKEKIVIQATEQETDEPPMEVRYFSPHRSKTGFSWIRVCIDSTINLAIKRKGATETLCYVFVMLTS